MKPFTFTGELYFYDQGSNSKKSITTVLTVNATTQAQALAIVANYGMESIKLVTPPRASAEPVDESLSNIVTALNGFVYLAQDASDSSQRAHYFELILEMAERAATLYHQFFVLRLRGGIEPELIGPFPNEDARDNAAQTLRRENDVDVILSLTGPGSSLTIDAYSSGFLNQED